MKKLLYLFVFIGVFFSVGCQTNPPPPPAPQPPQPAPEPLVFGVPSSTWQTLTQQQKQEVIDGYNQRQMMEEQNVPIEAAVGVAGAILDYEANKDQSQ